MGYQTAKGLPVPFGSDPNNVPGDLLAFAERLDSIFSARTYDEISALSGVDLWDGRIVTQSNAGAGLGRLWPGMYAYKASTATWQILVPRGTTPFTPTLAYGGNIPTLGTGGDRNGRYTRFGSLALYQFVIYTGSSGYTSGGGGTMTITLPLEYKDSTPSPPTDNRASPLGMLTIQGPTGTWYLGEAIAGWGSTPFVVQGRKPNLNGNYYSEALPVAVGNGITMWGTLLYETTEA